MTIVRGRSGSSSVGPTPGPADNFFGDTSGDINAIPNLVTAAANRSIAEATRDAYELANPGWVDAYDDTPAFGIFLFWQSGSDLITTGQVRVSGEWVDSSNTIGIQGLPGSGTDFSNISENHVPAIGPGPSFIPYDSGAQVSETGKFFTRELQVANESIDVGTEITLGDSVSTIGFKRQSDGSSYVVGSSEITEDGYSRYNRIRVKEEATNVINSTTDGNSPISTQTHEVIYASVENFLVSRIELESDDEIENLNISIIKVVDFQDKVIYPFVPNDVYLEGNGIFVVNSLPVTPDPKKTYILRDGLTGKFEINIDFATFVEALDSPTGPLFKIKFETTDTNGLNLRSRDFEVLPGLGVQKVPVLTTEGHDFDHLPVSDLRDNYRRYREISGNLSLTTPNDFDRDQHTRFVFTSTATVSFDTVFAWEEGASLEIIGRGGDGTLSISGFTINGNSSITVDDGFKVVLTYEDDTQTNWRSQQFPDTPDLSASYYEPIGRYVSTVEQFASPLGTAVNVTYGAGATTPDGYVTVNADGTIVVNQRGAFKFLFEVHIDLDLNNNNQFCNSLFQVEISTDSGATYDPYTETRIVELRRDSSSQNTVFDISDIWDSGDILRLRWINDSNQGPDLNTIFPFSISGASSLAGFNNCPSAEIDIYKVSDFQY